MQRGLVTWHDMAILKAPVLLGMQDASDSTISAMHQALVKTCSID